MTALRLIQKHGRLENVLAELEAKGKYDIPQPFPFDEARKLFKGERLTAHAHRHRVPYQGTSVGSAEALHVAAFLAGVFQNCLTRMHTKVCAMLCRAGGAARGCAAPAEVDACG